MIVNILLVEHLLEHYISGGGVLIWGQDSYFVKVIHTACGNIELTMSKDRACNIHASCIQCCSLCFVDCHAESGTDRELSPHKGKRIVLGRVAVYAREHETLHGLAGIVWNGFAV